MTTPEYLFLHDDVWPRDPRHRYRVYVWRSDGHDVLCAAPTMGGVGVALLALHEDQKQIGGTLGDLGRVGVLDVIPDGRPSDTGEWIVLPFDRGNHV